MRWYLSDDISPSQKSSFLYLCNTATFSSTVGLSTQVWPVCDLVPHKGRYRRAVRRVQPANVHSLGHRNNNLIPALSPQVPYQRNTILHPGIGCCDGLCLVQCKKYFQYKARQKKIIPGMFVLILMQCIYYGESKHVHEVPKCWRFWHQPIDLYLLELFILLSTAGCWGQNKRSVGCRCCEDDRGHIIFVVFSPDTPLVLCGSPCQWSYHLPTQ